MIRVKCDGGTSGAQISTADGALISGVTAITIRIEPNDIVRADVGICVQAVDVLAHPLLGLKTVEAAAAAHGYKLVLING